MEKKQTFIRKHKVSTMYALPDDTYFGKKIRSMKDTLKDNCKQLIKEFENDVKEYSEESGLLVEKSAQMVKDFAAQEVLFEEVRNAAEESRKADLNLEAKVTNLLTTNMENLKKAKEFVDSLASDEEEQ